MTQTDWLWLRGQVLDSQFRVEEPLLIAGGTALFRVVDLTRSQEFLIHVEEGELPSARVTFDRFREASFLEHPNLLRVVAAGCTECQTKNIVYIVTEMAQVDFAESSQRQTVSLNEVADLIRQIAAGLAYIHSQNLTYCALRAESVWRVGAQWKLADYSQLRVGGEHPAKETRRMLLMPSFNSPPEAYQGVVSPAWDVWSLGSMVRKLLLSHVDLGGTGEQSQKTASLNASLNKVSIPPPFDRFLRESLEPEPQDRASLDQLLEILSVPAISNGNSQAILPPVAEPAVNRHSESTQVSIKPRRNRNQRHPIALAIVAAALLLFALIVTSRRVYPQPVHRAYPTAQHRVSSASPISDVKPADSVGTHNNSEANPVAPAVNNSVAPAVNSSQTEQAISLLLDQWVNATRHRNVEQKVNCYAPWVDRFYGKRGVGESRLREQEQSVFARIGTIRKFEISNVVFSHVEPQSAIVSFDKAWEFSGNTRFAGAAREELVLRPFQGHWKITSQREVKVYWVDRQEM